MSHPRTPWAYDRYHNNEFNDGTGAACPPVWAKDRVHGCTGNCSKPDFPGRAPKVGDIALCGHGQPGVILHADKQEVTYPDGNRAQAWVGVHISSLGLIAGRPWSSRNPVIIGTVGDLLPNETVNEFVIRRCPHGWAPNDR